MEKPGTELNPQAQQEVVVDYVLQVKQQCHPTEENGVKITLVWFCLESTGCREFLIQVWAFQMLTVHKQ